MKIALVHYHLKTGGVTAVIRQQIAALQTSCDLLVMTGDRAGVQLACPVVEVPALGYDHPGQKRLHPEETVETMLRALHQRWPNGCDLVHVHNPLLAKNRQLLQIIKGLQQAGITFFLQIHDFAEDGRPQVYFDESYPKDCHYGVINQRDLGKLLAAGLKKTGLHYLPNAVEPGVVGPKRPPNSKILYPVRAIRRKNLGEAILLSLFFNHGQRLVVTQPPNSPMDAASYRDWADWITKHHLPIDLEAGQRSDFGTLLAESESVVTTSVAEGFGMAFLEPWAAGKPLWGRRLPDICADYQVNGIRLDHLYDRMNVPLEWIGKDRFCNRWHTAVFTAARRFGHHVNKDRITEAFERMTAGGVVDFGLLNETMQRRVLSRVIVDPTDKEKLIGVNPRLAAPETDSMSDSAIESNRDSVRKNYGLDRYRERLMSIHERVVERTVRHHIDKTVLLDSFFNLDHFSLLQWEPYGQA